MPLEIQFTYKEYGRDAVVYGDIGKQSKQLNGLMVVNTFIAY